MIRIMKNSDLTQCGSIYTKAFPIEYWGIDWTTENATEYLQDFFEQRRFVGFVYEENKEVLGCIFALRKISGSKEEIYINEMAVLPERQGQGIGKQLLNAVKDYSKDKGLAGIVLYTSEYAPAAKFYEKNGFKLSKGTICMYCE
jgi:ribosomal protein S18 acetylase RimI-like enzyme